MVGRRGHGTRVPRYPSQVDSDVGATCDVRDDGMGRTVMNPGGTTNTHDQAWAQSQNFQSQVHFASQERPHDRGTVNDELKLQYCNILGFKNGPPDAIAHAADLRVLTGGRASRKIGSASAHHRPSYDISTSPA